MLESSTSSKPPADSKKKGQAVPDFHTVNSSINYSAPINPLNKPVNIKPSTFGKQNNLKRASLIKKSVVARKNYDGSN